MTETPTKELRVAPMRGIDELKKVKDRRPFEAFHIHLADGRDLRIMHPDNVAWGPGETARVVVLVHEGGWEVIDPMLVTGVRIPHPPQPTNA